MKIYNKPEFYVEEFLPNVAVASCTRDFTGETEYTPQVITCMRNTKNPTKDKIFTDGTQNCYIPDAIGWVEAGTYKVSDLDDKIGGTINNPSGNITVSESGYWVIWGSGNHYGPATDAIIDIMINSY